MNMSDDRIKKEEKVDRLDLLAYAPCAFKHIFREGLDGVVEKHRGETGRLLNCFSPMGMGDDEDPYEELWKSTCIDQLPDIIASVGFGDYFRKDFVERFIDKGYFKSVWQEGNGELFEKAGIPDPEGHYSIYGIIPFLMLIDRTKLGDVPAPGKWSDLLDPAFKNNIVLSGGGSIEDVADLALIFFYSDHGDEGIARLADNVKGTASPAEIARMAGRPNTEGAAVNIMPYVFASCCPKTDNTYLLWPEDGAMASPVYLLAKASRSSDSDALIDYITGSELGRQMVLSCFPALNPHVENNLPDNASFKWPGWDFIKSHDMVELRDHVHEYFVSRWYETRKEERK